MYTAAMFGSASDPMWTWTCTAEAFSLRPHDPLSVVSTYIEHVVPTVRHGKK